MEKLLISIQPSYIQKILSGSKRCEYRTRLCTRPINTILLYATSPIKAIVGEASIKGVLSLPPDMLWAQTSDFGGIDYASYKKYFFNRNIANAYILENVQVFKNSVPLKDIGIKAPPQSYMYITEQQYSIICNYQK